MLGLSFAISIIMSFVCGTFVGILFEETSFQSYSREGIMRTSSIVLFVSTAAFIFIMMTCVSLKKEREYYHKNLPIEEWYEMHQLNNEKEHFIEYNK